MKISAVFREDHVRADARKSPSARNPGGGVGVKLMNMQKAIPDLNITTDIGNATEVTIIEALWFSSFKDFEANLDRVESTDTFKILWLSDVIPLKWRGSERERIFDMVDVVAGNSQYFVDLFQVYTPTTLLTDPIDCDSVSVSEKTPSVFGMSNISLQKGIPQLIEIYDLLACTDLEVEKGFIGSSSVWGAAIDPKLSNEIETLLFNISDWVKQGLDRQEILQLIAKLFIFMGVTRYDSFCYAMVEAMLAGCHCVCGEHPIYDERDDVIHRFKTVDEAVSLVKQIYEEFYPKPNIDARDFVFQNYGIDVFKRQLSKIIGAGVLP